MGYLIIILSLTVKATISAVVFEGTASTQNINIYQAGCQQGMNDGDEKLYIPSEMRQKGVERIDDNVANTFPREYSKLVQDVLQLMEDRSGFEPRDCTDISLLGKNESGVYMIFPKGTAGFPVYCDMETDGGNWTVIQRRVDGSVDFFLSWGDYLVGFGDLHHEFWLGNQQIHSIVSQGWYELRIDMVGPEGEVRYAKHDVFSIGDVNTQFVLMVDGYHGDAGDDLAYQSGMKFSTKDKDNDAHRLTCAVSNIGAWWFNACHHSNLNGKYGSREINKGINWKSITGFLKSLTKVDMKVRKWGRKY